MPRQVGAPSPAQAERAGDGVEACRRAQRGRGQDDGAVARTACRAAASPRSSARRAAPSPRRGSRLHPRPRRARARSRSRSAFSKISSIAARATWRAPSSSSGLARLELGLHRAAGVAHPRQRDRERVGQAGQPALGDLVEDALEQHRRRRSPRRSRPAGRPAWRPLATIAALSSSVIVEVTRSTSSCASSTTSTSCSGSIWRPSKASMAMKRGWSRRRRRPWRRRGPARRSTR